MADLEELIRKTDAAKAAMLPQPEVQEPKSVKKNLTQFGENSYQEMALSTAKKIVNDSVNGAKHGELLKAARLLGGYIAGGIIDEGIAFQELKNAIDSKDCNDYGAAYKTIKCGIEYGKLEPITQEQKEQDRQNWINEHGIKTYKKFVQRQEYTATNTHDVDVNEIPDNIHQQITSLLDFEYLRITDKTPIPTPEPVLMINGETIAAIEDIFTISGASKSGKSAFISMLIAGAITTTGNIIDGLEGVQVSPNVNNMAVIHFDTEQARHKHQRNLNTILTRANLSTCPDYFLSYNIRQLNIEDYSSFTTSICNNASKKFNGIHSIWIDGGADFIADVNDPARSNEAIKFFEDISVMYHTAVFIVVHTNPGSDKERGHFGSQCQRKSGGIISIKNDGDISFIEPKLLRYAGKSDIPQLMFQYDKEKGYHVGCGVKNEQEDQKAIKKIEGNWNVCKRVFSGQKSFIYSSAITTIMLEKKCSDKTAKTDFKGMKELEMILQGEDKRWRLNKDFSIGAIIEFTPL